MNLTRQVGISKPAEGLVMRDSTREPEQPLQQQEQEVLHHEQPVNEPSSDASDEIDMQGLLVDENIDRDTVASFDIPRNRNKRHRQSLNLKLYDILDFVLDGPTHKFPVRLTRTFMKSMLKGRDSLRNTTWRTFWSYFERIAREYLVRYQNEGAAYSVSIEFYRPLKETTMVIRVIDVTRRMAGFKRGFNYPETIL